MQLPQSQPAAHAFAARSGFLGRSATLGISATAGFALTVNSYSETFHSARLGVALVVLLAVHLVRFPRLVITRECKLYVCFIAYMFLQLAWTGDRSLALNTLVPAVNFLLILVYYSSVLAYHDNRAVLGGTFAGFLAGAAGYSLASGFPFSYPANFSYNAVAGIYLFGLFLTLLLLASGRFKLVLSGCAAVLLGLTLATTSIKANLGIVVGVAVSGILYLRHFVGMFRRHAWAILVLAGILGYAIATSDFLGENLQRGFDRVSIGVDVLRAREDLPGYSAYEKRSAWLAKGLEGWSRNPLFGYGVEAMRKDYGMTTHSTPVDLLYNSGLIGFALFYGLFLSLIFRLRQAKDHRADDMKALFAGVIGCYLFVSISAPLHYYGLLAAFIAISAAILAGFRCRGMAA